MDGRNIFEEVADVNSEVQGDSVSRCIEPGMSKRVEERVERRKATEPRCQGLHGLGGTPKPNSSVKSLHVDTLLESRCSEGK